MHSRSVYLAAVLFSGTQLGGATGTLGAFFWLLITCILTLFLLPVGQQIVVQKLSEHQQKRQKVLLGKAAELPVAPQTQLNAHLQRLLPLVDNHKQLEKTFQRVEDLEKRLEQLCLVLQVSFFEKIDYDKVLRVLSTLKFHF